MAKVDTFRCDLEGCGMVRERDANHWWILRPSPDGGDVTGLLILKWTPLIAAAGDVKHACGQEHAAQLAQRWMTTGSLEAPSARPISQPPPLPTNKEESHDR